MRITKEKVQLEIDLLNTMLGLPKGCSYQDKNLFMQGAYSGWKLRHIDGHEFTIGYVSLRELYLQVCGMVTGIELLQKYACGVVK
jgi:hypothetical protein